MRLLTPLLLLLALAGPALAQAPLGDLTKRFGGDDPADRDRAVAEVLERYAGWTDADIAALEKLAGDGDAEVASRAVRALEGVRWRRRMGRGLAEVMEEFGGTAAGTQEGAVELLMKGARRIRTGDATERELGEFFAVACERGWADVGDKATDVVASTCARAYAPLLGQWLDDPREAARREEPLLRAVIAIHANERVGWVAGLLTYPAPNVRRWAAAALGLLGARDQIPALVRALSDTDAFVALDALTALDRLGARPPVADLAKFLASANANVRLVAAEMLVAAGAKEQAGEIEKLLETTDTWQLSRAAKALRRLDPERCVRKFRQRLKSGELELSTLSTLAGIGECPRELAPDIVERLKSSDADTRRSAALILGWMKARERAGDVAALLDDANAGVRGDAATALGWLGARDQAGRIVGLLEDEGYGVAWQAVRALGELGAWEHIDAIVRKLESEDEAVLTLVARALQQLDAREHADGLVPLLRNGEYRVRNAAATALGVIGSGKQAEAIEPLLADESMDVEWSAAIALLRLGRTDAAVRWLEASSEDARHSQPDGLAGEMLRYHETVRLFFRFWDSGAIGISDADFQGLSLPVRGSWDPADVQEMIRRLRNIEAGGREDYARAAATLLMRWGEKPLVLPAALLESVAGRREGPSESARVAVLEALSAAGEPETYGALVTIRRLGRQVITVDDLRAVFKDQGLELEAGTLALSGRRSPECRTDLREILDAHLSGSTWVLEGRRVRVMPVDDAVSYWRRRLATK